MKLKTLKLKIDKLIEKGFGDCSVILEDADVNHYRLKGVDSNNYTRSKASIHDPVEVFDKDEMNEIKDEIQNYGLKKSNFESVVILYSDF